MSSDVAILVNQAGYDLDGPKRVWLQTEFDPEEIPSFQLLRNDDVVWEGEWGPSQRIEPWERWYRVGDLSLWREEGEYRVRVEWKGESVESLPFRIERLRLARWTGPLATHFFFIQRCGTEVPGWHPPCHMDDARMPDGSHRDLTGGWHDAGDYNKYNGYTPLSVYALAKYAESPSSKIAEWEEDLPLPMEEALWGAAWLRKCQDPKTKGLIGSVFSGYGFWGPPERETDNIPGNDDDRPVRPSEWAENEMAVAAYAVLARITKDAGWKQAGEGLWDVVCRRDPGNDLLRRSKRLLAATELFRTTGDESLKTYAFSDAEFLIRTQAEDGGWNIWPIVDFGLPPASLAEFLIAFPENDLSSPARDALRRYLNFRESRRAHPFDIPRWSETEYFYPFVPDKWYVGQNSMYLSQAWADLLIGKVFPEWEKRTRLWAAGCLDWVLGANPIGVCMMYGAGSVHLRRYHHRYEAIPNGENGLVPGAICNGITRRRSDLDAPYLDLEGNSWQTNEPWLPHNAYYLLALAMY